MKAVILPIRINTDDYLVIQKYAKDNYLPVSTLIRQIVLKTIKNENK